MKFRILKNKRALSPALSGIILVAVSVTYAFVAASWLGEITLNVMSLEELKITDCEWAQDFSHADLTIKNIGTQAATLNSIQVNGKTTEDFEIVEGNQRINPGRSATIRVSKSFTLSTKYEFKLTTKRQTPIKYVSVSQPGSEKSNEASIHYIDLISDVDGSPDKGSHSNFAHQQGEHNGLFDAILEADCGSGITSMVQYPDGSTTNYGTQLDFINAQESSPDGDYLTIHEQNLGGDVLGYPSIRSKSNSAQSHNTNKHTITLPEKIEEGDTLLVVFVCDGKEQISWEKEWMVIYEDGGKNGPTMSIAWKKATDKEAQTINVNTKGSQQSTHLSYAIQNANDPTINPPEASPASSGNDDSPDAKELTPSGGLKSYLWLAFYGSDGKFTAKDYPGKYTENQESYKSSNSNNDACAIGAATREFMSSSEDTRDFKMKNSEEWQAATVLVYPEQAVDDYELDFEYEWIDADYDETSEQVCIFVETATQDNEKLVAYEWNGATWQDLGPLDSNGWNNFTSSFLNGPSYAINIRDKDKTNDPTQSSWNIDCIITECSSTEINYELDIEVQFKEVNIGNNYEQICIYMGSTTAEPLDVYIWNDGNWEMLASNLLQNQWNNMTRTITQNTVTLRFLGSLESNDVIQDRWEINSVLLYGPP